MGSHIDKPTPEGLSGHLCSVQGSPRTETFTASSAEWPVPRRPLFSSLLPPLPPHASSSPVGNGTGRRRAAERWGPGARRPGRWAAGLAASGFVLGGGTPTAERGGRADQAASAAPGAPPPKPPESRAPPGPALRHPRRPPRGAPAGAGPHAHRERGRAPSPPPSHGGARVARGRSPYETTRHPGPLRTPAIRARRVPYAGSARYRPPPEPAAHASRPSPPTIRPRRARPPPARASRRRGCPAPGCGALHHPGALRHPPHRRRRRGGGARERGYGKVWPGRPGWGELSGGRPGEGRVSTA